MEIYSGEKLRDYIQYKNVLALRQRYLVEDLISYLQSDNDGKLCCLYGLQDTGKTVVMLHSIATINDYDSTVYILCDREDSFDELEQYLNENVSVFSDIKYVFIDEATFISDFVPCSSVLADDYASAGKKIVLTGKYSLGFRLACQEELYDKLHMIHTTYIPFDEYHYLLGKNLNEYVKHGGTLTDDSFNYNDEGVVKYINTAIASNIVHSLHQHEEERNYLVCACDDDEIVALTNRIIKLNNIKFIIKTIKRTIKSHKMSDYKDIGKKIIAELERDVFAGIDADDTAIKLLNQYLLSLDIIYPRPLSDQIIFIQPGMRYAQCLTIVSALKKSTIFAPLSQQERMDLADVIMSDVKDSILEQMMYYRLMN